MSDSGGFFVSDKFKTVCRSLNIKQAFTSSYYHQSMSDTQQESMTANHRDNISQTNRTGNNGQKGSVNSVPLHRNTVEPSQESDTHTTTRYGRMI